MRVEAPHPLGMRQVHPRRTQTRRLFFSSLRGYQRAWLRGDLIAGLTVWAVLIPESLAYATIAGVSPVVGLYAAPGALLLYAALGQFQAPCLRADVRNRGAVGGDRRGHRPGR